MAPRGVTVRHGEYVVHVASTADAARFISDMRQWQAQPAVCVGPYASNAATIMELAEWVHNQLVEIFPDEKITNIKDGIYHAKKLKCIDASQVAKALQPVVSLQSTLKHFNQQWVSNVRNRVSGLAKEIRSARENAVGELAVVPNEHVVLDCATSGSDTCGLSHADLYAEDGFPQPGNSSDGLRDPAAVSPRSTCISASASEGVAPEEESLYSRDELAELHGQHVKCLDKIVKLQVELRDAKKSSAHLLFDLRRAQEHDDPGALSTLQKSSKEYDAGIDHEIDLKVQLEGAMALSVRLGADLAVAKAAGHNPIGHLMKDLHHFASPSG